MDGKRRLILVVVLVFTLHGTFGWRADCTRSSRGYRRNGSARGGQTTDIPPEQRLVGRNSTLRSRECVIGRCGGEMRSMEYRHPNHRPHESFRRRPATNTRVSNTVLTNEVPLRSADRFDRGSPKKTKVYPHTHQEAGVDDTQGVQATSTEGFDRDSGVSGGATRTRDPRAGMELDFDSMNEDSFGSLLPREETEGGGLRGDDERFMRMAMRLADQAGREGEVPVGAVLAESEPSPDGRRRVLSTGRNTVERNRDATAHAEMLCLQAASRVRRNWRLSGTTLYVTMEPCVMCLSAAQLFRVDKVVYGASSPNLGACGGWVDLPARKHAFHDLEVRGGVLGEECARPLREFFRSRRHPKPPASLDVREGEADEGNEH